MTQPGLSPLPPVYTCRLHGAPALNRALRDRFATLREEPATRRSHYFAGRFENLYVDRDRIPEVEPLLEQALDYARRLLGGVPLRVGFWFNAAGPGQRTGLHTHDDDDELLSAVYYIDAPVGSGRLLLHAGSVQLCVLPEPGLLVLFPPDLPHEVEVNASGGNRLSLAMNFGPAG
jgi:hypothetical protein